MVRKFKEVNWKAWPGRDTLIPSSGFTEGSRSFPTTGDIGQAGCLNDNASGVSQIVAPRPSEWSRYTDSSLRPNIVCFALL
ncbi:hypothetical protein R1flu_005935 [Riccia fluitans]|uniref:Uncharacterized protein n=1 Tax=Riccia fluitans TaxID=41844 RepID=A0ABD1YUK5_9MARC